MRVKVTSRSCSSGRALGDIAGGQRGDGEGLPGAGARLEDGDPGRQRAADVERPDVAAEAAHRSKTASVWRRPFQRRTRVAAEARRLGVVPAFALLIWAWRLGCQLVEARDVAPDELVLEVGVFVGELPARLPRRAGGLLGVAALVGGCRVGRGGHAGERERLAHAAVVEVDEGRERLAHPFAADRRVVGERWDPGDRDGRVVRRAPAGLPDRDCREGAIGVCRGQSEPADVGLEAVAGIDARVGDGPQHVAVDAGDGAAQRAAVGERDLDVHGGRLPACLLLAGPLQLRSRRGGDVRDDRADAVDDGRCELARGQRPARDLGRDARFDVRAGEHPVEQPLPDTPTLQRVELDRQRVIELVGVVPDADAEPLAQEGADGVAGEAHEVFELDERLLARRQRPG